MPGLNRLKRINLDFNQLLITMKKNQWIIIILIFSTFYLSFTVHAKESRTIVREAKSTITPVEMNIGDILEFKLKNGEVRTIKMEATNALVLMTNLNKLLTYQKGGGTLYHFTCKLNIDGHSMQLERYVGTQESFYEPYVINGLRIWFDGVAAIIDNGIVSETHGKCKPGKAARFGISDMTERICPERVYSFYDNPSSFIRISDTFNGDNCWMGAYNGYEAHGGLDVNQEPGVPNYSPIAFDNQFFFNSLAKGDNNNRWRAIRKWENGDEWIVQNHHVINLFIPEHTPVKAGAKIIEASGVNSRQVQHAHYVFRLNSPLEEEEILLDPWILFWQAFEDNKAINGKIKAGIAPFNPGKTGVYYEFSPKGSQPGSPDGKLSYYWTFGDGGWSDLEKPRYAYSNPGLYPVTLVVEDGMHRASFTQHITIDGEKAEKPALIISSPDEPSFRVRPVQMMDTYGISVRDIPNTVHFVARPSRPIPEKKTVYLQNSGKGTINDPVTPSILYFQGEGWLNLSIQGSGNNRQLNLSVDATGFPTGVYMARVSIELNGALNELQGFMVQMTVPTHPPMHWKHTKVEEVIHHGDLRYNRFYATPYFWVRPQFSRWVEKGYRNDYFLTNGGRSVAGEYARFNPDLEAGKYEVYLADETPFEPERRAHFALVEPNVSPMWSMDRITVSPDGPGRVNSVLNPESRFAVVVKSKIGKKLIWMEPSKSRMIGTFEFEEGMDGYVDIIADGSTGQVLADAIIFKRIID
jgi:PKD repeat protein